MNLRNKILLTTVMILLVSLVVIAADEKDSDLDGIPDSTDKYPFDYDNDGIPDIWEKKNGLRYDADDADEDPDNDGIKNIDEYKQGTNPLFSDLAERKAQQPQLELFTPVERTMARGLIWVGAGIFLFLVVIFILYRVHIFRVFKFMHHVSKKHFEQQEVPRAAKSKQVLAPRSKYPGIMALPAAATRHPAVRFVPRIRRPVAKAQPKVSARDRKKLLEKRKVVLKKQQAVKRLEEKVKKEENDFYIPLEDLQKTYQKKTFERLAEHIKKTPENIFGRLNEHINIYKRSEQYGEAQLMKLAKFGK